ncbi:Glutamyl-tRNA(Gln) amidotransferase subunit A, partial [Pseudocercospora fuligena]
SFVDDTMIDVRELTIAKAHDAFRDGSLTATSLCAAYLDRIERLDKAGLRLNSTMALSKTALQEATALDALYHATGKFKGTLHGIPILVKDQADTEGMVTTYGSAVAKNNIASQDAFVVTKLKEAGAVIVGKTTCAEWAATWFSANGATDYEFTKNPYNLEHDVGASSGGSGAAVAANFAMLAVGEDTGGSIRVPSSFCNLVGIRVTPGLISRTGFCPLVKDQDTPGPMARTVTGCAIMLDAMVGYDPADEYTYVAATAKSLGNPRGGSYAAQLDQGLDKLKGAKLGVLRQLFGPDSDEHCHAVNLVMHDVLNTFKEAGTHLIDAHIDNLDNAFTSCELYTIRSRSDINSFLATKPHLPQDLAEIVPKTPAKPFLDLASSMAHGPSNPLDHPAYASRLLARDELKRKVGCLFAEYELDALITPDVQVPPPLCSDAYSGRFENTSFPTNTFLASLTGFPAVSVPGGWTEDGLPVGLELVGLGFHEQHLLELARGVEILRSARRAPPGL